MLAAVKKRRRKRALISLVILALLIATILVALWSGITVSRYTVSLPGLPKAFEDYRIVVISDMHCQSFGENQEDLIAKIHSLDPDMIAFTGDMLDKTILDPQATQVLCEAFEGIVPMYAVLGNHDLWISSGDTKALTDVYASHGVTLLRGEAVPLTIGNDTVYLHGADDPAHWGNDTVGFLEENPPPVSPVDHAVNILLYHRANAFPALNSLGFDLIIASHMHGGQVRIPFIGGLVSPTRELFPDYTAGYFSENNTQMVVSRGLGNSVSVPRVFNPPELVLITLRGEQK